MKKFIAIFFLCVFWSGTATSFDEEKYTSEAKMKINSSKKDFIKKDDQHKLTYKNLEDDIEGRFLYDQEDNSNDYQVHAIYIIASDSKDKKFDTNGTIEKIVFLGNKYLKSKTTEKQFRLDLTKTGKLDVSFIRLGKTKKKINKLQDAAGYFSAMAIKNGFYDPKKLYTIFYQDKYKNEWGQAGNATFVGPKGNIEVVMGVTYLGNNPVIEGFHPHVHELFHSLGFVQLCAPGALNEPNSRWGKNDHLGYKNDVMSEGGGKLDYMDRYVDVKRIEYYGHPNRNCEMDLKKSAFLEPTEEDFQLQPRSKSCKLTRWQPEYNHQHSLDCLARLNF